MEVRLTTRDGRKLRGELQGSGGTLAKPLQVPRLIRHRLLEEERGKGRRGFDTAGVLAEHAGNVSVWTHPNATEPGERLTTVKASEVERIEVTTDAMLGSRPTGHQPIAWVMVWERPLGAVEA